MSLNRSRFRLLIISASVLISFSHTPAGAQEAASSIATARPESASTKPESGDRDEIKQLKAELAQLRSLIEQQELKLGEMEKRLTAADPKSKIEELRPVAASAEQPKQPAASGAAPGASQTPSKAYDKAGLVAGWDGNHAFLRSADGSFETFLTGYGQLDFRGYAAGSHPPNTFLVRRARLSLEGKLFRYFDYKVEGDFADTTSTLLRDGWVRIHRIDEFQVTAGQFRVPFSQEEIRPDNVQDFVERSIVNSLAPSRSPGIMVSGAVAAGAFEYQLGAFNGKGLLANNNNGTPENALRLRVSPWKATDIFLLKGLAFGGAFTVGRNVNAQSLRGLTESRSFIYFAAEPVNGKLTRTNGELTWLLGPAAIRAEYDQVNQARDNLGSKGTNLPGVVAKGYTAQFTYLLTGENKLEAGSVEPRHNLFSNEGGKTGLGAWELKARYASLQFSDASAKSNRAQTIFFGANWYLNKFVRYVFDAGLERYTDPKRSPNPGDTNYFVVLSRIQFAF
jgi:phosphate-selective porin OprO/OprP